MKFSEIISIPWTNLKTVSIKRVILKGEGRQNVLIFYSIRFAQTAQITVAPSRRA